MNIRHFLAARIPNSFVIPLVGIHATILSIFIALSVAWVLHISSKIYDVETDALNLARSVNDIRFSSHWFKLVGPGGKFLEKWSSEEDQIQEWLAMYWVDPTGAIMNLDHLPLKTYFSDIGLNQTEFKLCLMGVLALRYPFPERMVIKDGKLRALQPSPAIVFSNMKDIDVWTASVEKKFRVIAGNINWFGSDVFIQGFDWNKEIKLHYKFWKNNPEGYGPEALRGFQELPKEFCSNISEIYNLSKTLNSKLNRFNFLKRLNPSKPIVIFTLIFSIITFFSGVFSPLIRPRINKFMIIWIPTLFYLYFLGYLVVWVFRNWILGRIE